MYADMWGRHSHLASTQEAQGSTLLSAKAKGGISRLGSLCLTLVGRANWGPERRGTDPGDWWIWWVRTPDLSGRSSYVWGIFDGSWLRSLLLPAKSPRSLGLGGQELGSGSEDSVVRGALMTSSLNLQTRECAAFRLQVFRG